MAPPRKLTREVEIEIVKLLEAGATMAIAAKGVQLTRATLYRHAARAPKFAAAVQEAKDLCDDAIEANMYRIAMGAKAATKGEVVAAIFWLKNRRPKQWRDLQAHEHSGPEGGPIEYSAADAANSARDKLLS